MYLLGFLVSYNSTLVGPRVEGSNETRLDHKCDAAKSFGLVDGSGDKAPEPAMCSPLHRN